MGASAGSGRAAARRTGRAVASILVATALLAGCASPAPTAPHASASATPGPSIGSAAPLPSRSPAPASSPVPSDAAWRPIGELAGASPVATLVPIASAGPYIPPATAFALTSLSREPAAALAARLVIEPATPLAVEAGADAAHVTVRPSSSLPAGAVIRFRLSDSRGALAASWAYQVDQAPRIVATLPGDGATDVPVNTGIEATFDQDGVAVRAADVTISPAVRGRVEVNGRTAAFVPEALAPATLYTVTVHKGVARPGSTFSLAQDMTWRFQTSRATSDAAASAQFVGQLFDARPGDQAILSVAVDTPEGTTVPQAQVVAARLPSRAAAIAAVQTLAARPSWAMAGHDAVVPVAGLPVVLRARRSIEALRNSWVSVVRLPQALPAGWYLITLTANDYVSQAVLQVTDLAPFVALTATRTLVWVNDTTTHGPVAGCRVSLNPGGTIGQTNATGILDAATPPAVAGGIGTTGPKGDQSLAAGVVLVLDARDGRGAFTVPGAGVLSGMAIDASGSPVSRADDWWHALTTDRLEYRATDTVNAWGYLRGRTGRDVPSSVDLVLASTPGGPPVATATVATRSSGAYAATLSIDDLPAGSYNLTVRVGGADVDTAWISVGEIRKPLYRLEVTADRLAAMGGDEVGVTVTSSFYDGSPAAGIAVEGDGKDSLISTPLQTGIDGAARATFTATGEAKQSGAWPSQRSLSIRAAAAEDGAISVGGTLLVFSSAFLVDATAALRGKTVTVDGAIHTVNLSHLNSLPNVDAASMADPRGAAVRRQAATITVTEHWSVARRIGTSYDPITKRTSPTYDWTERTRTLAPVRVVSGADGRFHVTIAVARADHWYTATVTTFDAARRASEADASTTASAQAEPAVPPILTFADATGRACPVSCTVGQMYTVRLVGARALPRGGANRYLFLVEQRGLRRWAISTAPSRTETFRAADAPAVQLDAVWFTGTAYALAGNDPVASLALETRTLHVAVTSDLAHYGPGATASVRVSVTGPDGRPSAGATLVAAVVDEKLFDASGGPPIADPVAMLYGSVPSGVLALSGYPSLTAAQDYGACTGRAMADVAWSVTASTCGGGKGSTTGGGGDGAASARSDFRDALLFATFTTDAAGRATITVPLSDDLTTWRVAVAALDDQIRGGLGTTGLPVGLPFFADVTAAPEFLASDRPSIVVRAFGTAVRPAATVSFTVSSDTLPMAPVTVSAAASTGATVPLPSLTPGTHRLTIVASDGTHRDAIVRSFVVVNSRRASPVVQSWPLSGGTLRPTADVPGLSTFVITDAGRGRWVERLLELASGEGTRADQRAAAIGARDILSSTFHLGDAALPPKGEGVDAFLTPDGGIAILPYGSADLEMTTRALLAAPEIATPATSDWLRAIAANPAETPERRSVALVGLAATGEPVLPALQARAAATTTPPREALWLGLGLAALGDQPGAASLAARVAADAGERRGIELRIAVDGDADAVAEATARFAELAAAVGDPLAGPALAYTAAHPSRSDLHVAEELATIRSLIAREPATAARVAWTVDGRRTVTDLSDGTALSLVLTPAQRRTLTLEAVAGNLTVVGRWLSEGPPASPAVSSLALTRSVTPAGSIARSAVVRVVLSPSYLAGALTGDYRVDEVVPSGLVPLDSGRSWDTASDTPADASLARCEPPVAVDGQVVRFATASSSRSPTLCYLARVATPGSFTWEPATIWSEEAPEDWAATPQLSVTIR